MHSIIIADTSCLILLGKINEFELLKLLYQHVIITDVVASEYGNKLPDWMEIRQVKNVSVQHALEIEIDSGEASSIALALETSHSIVVLDDLRARKIADKLKINYTGTFGIIAQAKLKGKIASVKPVIEKIKQTNFRISDKIIAETLKSAGEL
jgi:predicted nucleic acid-binding protein